MDKPDDDRSQQDGSGAHQPRQDQPPQDQPPQHQPQSEQPPQERTPEQQAQGGPNTAAQEAGSGASAEPDGLLPLGPPVFGPWRIVTAILPMVVFLLGNLFGAYLENHRVHLFEEERRLEEEAASIDDVYVRDRGSGREGELPSGVAAWFAHWFPLDQTWYPSTYTLTIVLTTAVVLIGLPGYLRVPFRITWMGPAIGAVGIVVWVGLWYLDEALLGIGSWLAPMLGGTRSEFNPMEVLADRPVWMYQFLAIRLFGLVLLIPVIEEFFVRGFVMRYVDDPDWDQIPLGLATWKGIAGVLVYAVISHPGELIAAVAWFGMVTWLYLRTRSLWDCVAAHLVTNLLLAIFVLTTGTWALW